MSIAFGAPGVPDQPPAPPERPDAPPPAPVAAAPQDLGPSSLEPTIRGMLQAATNLANYFGADADLPEQWRFTEEELSLLVPALARWSYRVPKVRSIVETGDAAVAVPVLVGYLTRNVIDGARARNDRSEKGNRHDQPALPPDLEGEAAPASRVPSDGDARDVRVGIGASRLEPLASALARPPAGD